MTQSIKKVLAKIPKLQVTYIRIRHWWFRFNEKRLRLHLKQISEANPNPVFVKVGANDGITGDPCGDEFLSRKQWRGILIEPIPYCVEKLRLVYKDQERFTIEPVAVGPPGEATIYYVAKEAMTALDDLPTWYDQLGGFSRSHIVTHLSERIVPFIRESKISVESLNAILARNRVGHIDFLHVDTEGHDLEVLKTIDFNQFKPKSIYIEHKHLSKPHREDLRMMLLRQGYRVRNAGTDFFATLR
jgi:FkbM family methyltransferase